MLWYLQAKHLFDLDSLRLYQCFYGAASSAVISVLSHDSTQKTSLISWSASSCLNIFCFEINSAEKLQLSVVKNPLSVLGFFRFHELSVSSSSGVDVIAEPIVMLASGRCHQAEDDGNVPCRWEWLFLLR